MCALYCIDVSAQTPLSKENKLKAAYLLNFTKFIEWPATSADEQSSTIRICVDSSSEFLEFLSPLVTQASEFISKFEFMNILFPAWLPALK